MLKIKNGITARFSRQILKHNAKIHNGMADNVTPEFSDQAKNFKPGIYRHFKGGMYHALFVARSSEDRNEEFVVYKSLEKGLMWIRPLTMFLEEVDRDGYKGPRFVWIREKT